MLHWCWPHLSWHMKCVQHAAHNPKFEKTGLFRHPLWWPYSGLPNRSVRMLIYFAFLATLNPLLGHVGPALDQFWDQMPPCMLIEHIQCIKIILLSTSFGNDRTRFPTIISKFKLLWKIWLSVCENDAISVMSLYTLTQKSADLIMGWFKHKLAFSYWLKWIST